MKIEDAKGPITVTLPLEVRFEEDKPYFIRLTHTNPEAEITVTGLLNENVKLVLNQPVIFEAVRKAEPLFPGENPLLGWRVITEDPTA